MNNTASKLKVTIISFSYKKGVPVCSNPHGGGFVFDCRSIENPGRDERFKTKHGKDQGVIDFLEKLDEAKDFQKHVFGLVDQTVKKYQTRKFESLFVAFGCTGGQHRSVYFSEQLKKHLLDKFDVDVQIQHREQGPI